MRIGVYGGSFDPIHIGHLLVAETCRERLQLDEVRFVLAHQSPLKLARKPTPDKQRAEMLQLAIGGHSAFKMDLREVERGGVSYSVDTLREIRHEQPEAELFFLMGSDSLAELDRWKEPEEICKLAYLVVVARGGEPEPKWGILDQFMAAERIKAFRELSVPMPQIEISSSDLRERVNRGKSIRYCVPRAVEVYIEHHGLYADKST